MLRPYQVQDVAFAIKNRRSLNLSDPGVGKTIPAVVYTYWCWVDLGVRSVWVQPKSLMEKNRTELLRFSEFQPEDVVIVDGPPKKREQIYKSNAKVFLMGPEMFAKEWSKLPPIGNLVADEIHMYWGSATSKRTQGWWDSMKKIDRFLGMTGTLIDGRYSSAYPAIHVIEPRYYGNVQNFNAHHAQYDFFGNIVGWRNPERIKEILSRHSVRHTFTEVYGPEAKIIIPEYAEMSPKQASIYKELHEKALIELEDEFIEAGMPGVMAIRARQVLSCPELFECKDTPGKDDLLEVHFSNPGPIAVFAVFVAEQERLLKLAQKCGRKAAIMNGNVTAKDRSDIDEAFKKGELDAVICSPKVAAVGFNWHHLDRMVFASCDYQDSSFFQAYRRGIRGQRDHPLLIYVMKYKDSIDDRIWQVIEKKSVEANAVDPTREIFRINA